MIPENARDLFAPEMTTNPFETLDNLRPLSPFPTALNAAGQPDGWALLRHDDVYGTLRDHGTFSSQFDMGPGGFRLPLIQNDPPKHMRMRRLVNSAFTPRRIAELQPWINELSNELLDDMPSGESDIVANYTIPLPVKVIAKLLGIPGEDYLTFKKWTDSLLNFSSDSMGGPGQDMMAMGSYFAQMAASRRTEGADDLISALVQADVEGEKLSEMEIIGFCVLLLVAGNETTTNLLGNALNLLASCPELWQRIHDDPELIDVFIEETLRLESPVQRLFRKTLREVEVNGKTIPADSFVHVFFGAANRDPDAWEAPNEFRFDRDLSHHVAFGMGIHYCLGAPLARAETKTTLLNLVRRYKAIEPGSVPGRRQSATPIIFGFRELPLRLVPN